MRFEVTNNCGLTSARRSVKKSWYVKKILLALALLSYFLGLYPAYAKSEYSSKTILINGFASAMPTIGFGFRNLQKKIPGSELYSYIGPLEGWTIIAPKVLRDVRETYRKNPNTDINLIGISFGANLLTRIVAVLDKENIPVSYLGILDGYPLTPITPNVRRVDNFTCTAIGCLQDKIQLSPGNDVTVHYAFQYDTTHIKLPDRFEVQRRIVRQISAYSLDLD